METETLQISRHKKYRDAHLEISRKREKAWREKNPNVLKLWREKKKLENPNWEKEYKIAYKLKHPQRVEELRLKHLSREKELNKLGYRDKYRKKTHTRYKQYGYNCKRTGRIFSLTEEEFGILLKGTCFYCGDKENIGIDRVDNKVGYLKNNVISCCKICNYLKRNFSQKEFINGCLKVAKFQSKKLYPRT